MPEQSTIDPEPLRGISLELGLTILWAVGIFIPFYLFWRDITHVTHGSILGNA